MKERLKGYKDCDWHFDDNEAVITVAGEEIDRIELNGLVEEWLIAYTDFTV